MASRPSRNLQVFCLFVVIAAICLTPLFVRAYRPSPTSTSTSVSPDNATITLGDTVTFTATVTAATGTPTGLVTFLDGNTPLGSGTLQIVAGNSQAAFSTSLLSASGSPHSITATYQGDPTHDTSSGSTSETVNVRTSTTSPLVLNPTTVMVDQSSMATVTVTDSGSVPPGPADTFTSTGAPATGRAGATATLFADGQVLVAGGLSSDGTTVLSSTEIYSVSGGTFSASGTMHSPRLGAVAVLLKNGKVLVAGGTVNINTNSGALNTAELFDPNAGTFSITLPNDQMTVARFSPMAVLLNNGKVLVAGGLDGTDTGLASAELYDPVADSFAATGSMSTARTGATATLLANGKVLIAGGSSDGTAAGALNTAELFDPAGNSGAGSFTPITGANSTLSANRWQPEAALLLSGKVLIAGGQNSGGARTSADIYDPVAITFSASNGSMAQAHANGSAVALPNGMVLLAGGTTSQTVDLYDADSDKFDTTGSLQQSDNGPPAVGATFAPALTSTLLNNGDVLVVGLTSTAPASDAEIYVPSFNPLGTVGFGSSEATDAFGATCVLNPSTSTASTCTATVTPAKIATSPHTITGTYPADAVHSTSNNTASLTVNKADTTTTVTSSANPSVFGQSVTFTATISPNAPGAPTGSVTFLDGGNPITTCTGPGTLSGGVATCATSAFSVGNHTITTSYAGDGNFNGGTGSLTGNPQVVNKADTITTITANTPNPSAVNQAVNITVSVTAKPPGAGTPTGSVLVSDGVGETCTVTSLSSGTGNCSLTPILAGTDTLTAQYNGDGNFNTSSSIGVSQTVVAPPSIAKAFSPNSIPLNGTSTLTFTITNPVANTVAEAGVAFSDTLPTGLVVATPNGLTNSCGGTPSATAGGTSISLTGGSIAVNTSCTVVVNVTGTAAGSFTNTSGAVSSTNGGTGNTASDTLIVVAPPSIAKAFSPNSIPLNGTSTLTFTITNPVANTVAEAGVAFSDTLPTGLVVATPNGLTNSCGGTPSATAGGTSISLTGGSIAVNTSCAVVVNVTGTAAGSFTNTSGAVSSTNGGTGNTASDTLAVVAPPSIAKAFSPTTVVVNQITTLTFTIKNPSADTLSEAGVAFTDTLPTGLVVATPNGLANSCGGTPSATAGGTSISLTGGTIPVNTSCTLAANVIATASGSYTNTSGSVSSTNGGTGNTATASVAANTRQTNTAVTFSVPTVSIATPITVTVTVTDTDANGVALTPAGTVTLGSTVGGDTFSNPGNSCPLASNGLPTGKSSCSVTLTAPHVAMNPHTITANYPVDPQHSASSGSNDLTVNPANTKTVIPSGTNLQPALAFTDQLVIFTGVVTNTDNGSIASPVGTLQFLVDGQVIGTATLIQKDATSSSATFTAKLSQIGSVPTSGSPVAHSVTANFKPNADFASPGASTDSIDMTFAPAITNIPGQTIAPVTFPINPTGATGNITFQCSVLLLGSTTLSPNSPICTLSTTSNGVTATLTTLPASSSMATPGPSFRAANQQPVVFYSLSMPLAIVIGVLLIGGAERKHWSRRKLFGLVGMMLLLSLLVIAAGCGGGFNNANNLQPLGNGTASGQYVISVVGTDSSGHVVVVATMQLTVQL